MRIERVNIVDPGSIKSISEKFQQGNKCLDKIGINERNHEPIGACFVASWLASQGVKVKVVYPRSSNLSVDEVLDGNPQIIGFSCLTYNYQMAKELAMKIKEIKPEIITVIGGYHATCVPEEVSKEVLGQIYLFDWVVSQEADWTMGDIVEYYNEQREIEDIRGKFIYKKRQINNFSRFDLNLNPFPFRTKEMMDGRRRQGLYYPAPSQQKSVGLFVWSRGCPFNCEFCISAKMFPNCGAKESPVKYQKIDNIIKEVTFCQKEYGTNYGFVVDLNFYGGDKDRVRELCCRLGETGLKWYAMSRLDVDPELFEIMKTGGCTEIGFGVESLTNQRKSGVKMSIKAWRNKAEKVASFVKDLGILTKFYYILGGPGETLDDIKAEGEAICKIYSDEIRLSWMMISPGTPLFKKLKQSGGLEENGENLSLFSTDYPVIRVPETDAEMLQKVRLEIYREFYNPNRYGSYAKKRIKSFSHLQQSFEEWDKILKQSLGVGWK